MNKDDLQRLRTEPFSLDECLISKVEQMVIFDHSEFHQSFGPDGNIRWPLFIQALALGITKKTVHSLKGKKVLDIGCGEQHDLVTYLRKMEVDAEGIDPKIKESQPWLIGAAIGGDKSIPRPDGHYDLILGHCMYPVYQGLQEGKVDAEDIASSMIKMIETLRVLKNSGGFVAYPEINKKEGLGAIIGYDRWKIRSEEVRCKYTSYCQRSRTVISKD